MKYISALFLLMSIGFLTSCQDDDNTFGTIEAPSNLQIEHTIVNADAENEFGDGSGQVLFTATADNATNFKFFFGDNNLENETNGTTSHTYALTGINTYTVTVEASGVGGTSTSATTEVTVLSLFDDPVTKEFLAGGEGQSKTWYIAKEVSGHLGVGPVDSATPDFFAASANGLAGCFYDDIFTISQTNDDLSFVHENQGVSFANAAFTPSGEDQCIDIDVTGTKVMTLSPSTTTIPEALTTGTQLNIGDEGFFGYFINSSSFEVLEINENSMFLRALSGQADPLAWYFILTTNPDGTIGEGGEDSNVLETEYTNEVFSEEFEVDGVPDPNIWNFEIGNGEEQGIPGWGNQESQYYTDDNAVVEDGVLKITARQESSNGFDYTSSRITTLHKFSFEYGRIEVRAKLPEGGGTWPAIWMLGENFPEVGWPETGEIDIMEHRGNEQDVIHGSLHLPGNSAGNAISETTTVPGVSDEFNNYTVEWSEDRILFAVNDVVYHEYQNFSSTPFNSPFFIILNVAMGGTFGGDIDPSFTESTMEIDYIRVYQ